MLFTSLNFLLIFLPITFIAFHLSVRLLGGEWALAVLLLASLAFYGVWSKVYLSLLAGQLLVNYMLARTISTKDNERAKTWLLRAGVIFNLALLGYFKYRNFFLGVVTDFGGPDFGLAPLFVPLGISFHTFQQIAFLADVSEESEDVPPLRRYALFVLFFPQLIAGPVALHQEMGRQLERLSNSKAVSLETIGPGVAIFLVGLFKKICLADSIAQYADHAFAWPLHLEFAEAWLGSICYMLQLYFDFSGYSEMALGLGLVFGLKLPLNFDTPFIATSMIDYWKRWHMSMTRFFTMYLYTPMALASHRTAEERGHGPARLFMNATLVPTFVTFLASGLWHGAGWTFITFGIVNGVGIIINHIWNAVSPVRLPNPIGWLLAMLCVLVSLVYFRSGSMAQAHAILGSMLDVRHFGVPSFLARALHAHFLPVTDWTIFGAPNVLPSVLGWIALLLPLSMLMPNLAKQGVALKPTPGLAAGTAVMLYLVIGLINEPRTFLYFQF